MKTPWGKSDSIQRFARGLAFVTTPSHGGFMVADGYARKHLSSAALLRGERCGKYYAFEEDCNFAIVAWEVSGFDIPSNIPSQEWHGFKREILLESLSHWHADYLIERGHTPTENGLKFFNENRQHDRMRADKSPDLIVSATGSIASWVPEGAVGVITADGSYWLVPADQYNNRSNLNLLSHYTNVQKVRQ